MSRSATLCTRPAESPRLDLLPQQRREVEADQVVERAARLVGIHQVLVDAALGLLDRRAHRVLGDLVEAHALEVLALERAVLVQDLGQVPGDRLALAVRVGREVEGVRLFHRALDRVDLRLALVDELVLHLEVALGVDRAFLLDEVAHVAVRGQDLEVRAEVLLDRFRLGRRLDDDEICAHFLGLIPVVPRDAKAAGPTAALLPARAVGVQCIASRRSSNTRSSIRW